MTASTYIEFDGPAIRGEVTDAEHGGAIQILSWNHAFAQLDKVARAAAGEARAGQAAHADFSFTKYLDTATDDLLRHCWNGAVIGRAVVSCYRSDGDAAVLYLRIVMEDVIVSNISIGGGQGDLPTENISLAYGKVTYEYRSQAPGRADRDGASHDLVRGVVG